MDEKLDLMLLRFQVSPSFDLAQFADDLPDEKLYLDKKQRHWLLTSHTTWNFGLQNKAYEK